MFTAVADALGWALTQAGVPFLIHYLDDFLFFQPLANPRLDLQRTVLDTLQELGVPIANEKIEGPSVVVTYIGIVIDTNRFELRIPEGKLVYMREQVRVWLRRRSGKYKELESLIGTFLTPALYDPGWADVPLTFVYPAISDQVTPPLCPSGLGGTGGPVLVGVFLQHWNGRSFLPQPSLPLTQVYTDAPGSFGCGGVVLRSHWFQLKWPPEWAEVDISVKELLPIVVAAATWGRGWTNIRICFHTDNMVVMAMLQNKLAWDPL